MKTVLAVLALSVFLGGCISIHSEEKEFGCKGPLNIEVLATEGGHIPNAEVYLDGKFIGSPMGSKLCLDCGEHAVRITAPGYKPYEKTITIIGRGNPQGLSVVLEKQ
jgi:hypothetical protein